MSLTTRPVDPITVDPWPSEEPLFVFSLVVSVLIWIVLLITIIGAIYAAMFGVFFFLLHLGFIAHVRGSAVRLGPNQFPELHQRVAQLAVRMGMTTVPEAYLMQAGGSLNAFATRFLGVNFIVLYADLLEACGSNDAARDMIIAHELGHIHRGHVRWHWLLLPSNIVPFLAMALSRAREYTCDRYGRAGAESTDGALLGLSILAAGAKYGPRVNREALVAQRETLNTGWMTLGEWLSTHPPLAKRLAQIEPALLGASPARLRAGPLRAAAMIAAVATPMIAATALALTMLPGWLAQAAAEAGASGESGFETPAVPYVPPRADSAALIARQGLASLATFIEQRRAAGNPAPWDTDELYDLWQEANPGQREPLDPFDGFRYGYQEREGQYRLWSSGPDPDTRADDIVIDSRTLSPGGR
jgi:Zn-dependent protease with chaperone function